jgi:mannose-6-phosphate isomerase-like protein (cupin superfamily)
MQALDLGAALSGMTVLSVTSATDEDEARAGMRELGWLNASLLGLVRFSGQTPWERHPDGDELLHILEGDVAITVLTDDGPVETPVRAGSLFIVPRGLWHRQRPRSVATVLFATPTMGSEHSWADDPRA